MAASICLPAEFEADFYGKTHSDLSSMSDEDLYLHYVTFGINEGRAASSAAGRDSFLRLIPREWSVLEIGPFCNPCLRGDNIRYFDVLDRAHLVERAKNLGFDYRKVPDIDFVSSSGDLSVVSGTFSGIFSSHCIEHQTDLIKHLNQVAALLRPEGLYFLMIPDKRYCFDHFIKESTIADVIDAHLAGRTSHAVRSVIEHRALTTHNDSLRHWQADHGTPFTPDQSARVENALSELRTSEGYIDVHAWQFTPASFRAVIDTLHRLRLIPMQVVRVYNTVFGANEFAAVLTAS
jgi:SAM-dependent methyltransferase